MSQHYTRNSVSAPKWCKKCSAVTQHKIWFPPNVGGGRLGHCLPCEAKQEAEHQRRMKEPAPAPAIVQEKLFA